MLEIPSWSGKETVRVGRGIWGASAGSDDDGMRTSVFSSTNWGELKRRTKNRLQGRNNNITRRTTTSREKTKHKQTVITDF